MRTIRLTYDVQAPPQRVFAELTDLGGLMRWRTMEGLRLEPEGPVTVGTRIHSVVKGPGGSMRFANEVTKLDPRDLVYEDRWLDGTFPIESAWRIEAAGQGSRVHWATRYENRGGLRLLGPLLGVMIRRGQLKDLATFARLVQD
jgi:uncharacterized protein YndB with AHSA1/START domain